MERYAKVAGALHDVGKVLFNATNKGLIAKIEECVPGSVGKLRLSFPYHEVLSAAIYSTYLWFERSEIKDEERMVVRAILLHHQGLRGVAASRYLEGLSEIARRVEGIDEEVSEEIAEVFKEVAKRLRGLDELNEIADFVDSFGIYRILENATITFTLIKVEDVSRGRALSGALMIADNAVARKHAGDVSDVRLYPMEMTWFIEKVRPPSS